MLSNDVVRAAIDARLDKISSDLGVTAERVIADIARIAFGGLSKFMRIGPDGDPIIDLSRCLPQDLDGLAEIFVEDFLDGRGEGQREVRRIKIKPIDKLRALESLARILGLFRDKETENSDRQTKAIKSFIDEMGRKGSKIPVHASRPGAGG